MAEIDEIDALATDIRDRLKKGRMGHPGSFDAAWQDRVVAPSRGAPAKDQPPAPFDARKMLEDAGFDLSGSSDAPAAAPQSSAIDARKMLLDAGFDLSGRQDAPSKSAQATQVLPGYDPSTGTLNGVQLPISTQARLNLHLGVGRGVKDILDTAAHALASGTSAVAHRFLSADMADAIQQSRDETIAADTAGRKSFDAAFGDSTAASIGRGAGNVIASAPLLALGGGVVGGGVNALTRASPALARTAATVEGSFPGRVALGATKAAAAGAAGSALAAGASESPLLETMERGALVGAPLGGAAPVIAAGARGAGRIVSGAIEPFTEAGRGSIADRVIRQFAAGGPIIADTTALVPGSAPTLAQATGNPGLATLERAVRDVNPNQFVARDAANAEARQLAFEAVAGDKQSLANLIRNRAAAADENLTQAFRSAGPVDSSSAVDLIDNILKSPSGQRDSVVKALKNIRGKLEFKGPPDADGNPTTEIETDPSQLYGIRQAITDMLSPAARGTESDARLASKELIKVKDHLDDLIEDGAPGYKNYLAGYASASRPITEQKFLQGLNLTDSKGNLTLGRVDSALKRIEAERAAPGTRPAKSLSDDSISQLYALRADLQRAGNSSLGKSIGSNTFQNLATNSAVGRIAGPLSLLEMAHNPLVAAALYGGKKLYATQNEAILDELTHRLLNPSAARNALMGAPPLRITQ